MGHSSLFVSFSVSSEEPLVCHCAFGIEYSLFETRSRTLLGNYTPRGGPEL